MKKKAQYFVKEYRVRPVTKKELTNLLDEDIGKTCVTQGHILNQKIIPFSKIRTYEKTGLLNPIYHRRKKYFKKSEIISLLKANESLRKPHQLDLFKNR